MFRKFSPPERSKLLCSNVVKFVPWEIARYLLDKKNFACLTNCHYADRAQNLPEPDSNNVLTVLQISSKSVHFRQNNSRTREHRQIAP